MKVRFKKTRGTGKGNRLLAVLAAVLLGVGLLVLYLWEQRPAGRPASVPSADGPVEEEDRVLIYDGGTAYALRQDLETVLILGIDKYAENPASTHNGVYEQSDFLLLLVVDRGAGHCWALHLNRDTMTEYQILTDSGAPVRTVVGQLALAHTYGGSPAAACRNVADAVSGLLYGVPVDHYVSLSMDGVAVLNDLAGGVEVEVLDDFSGIDDTLVQGRKVTLWGQHALNYVRIRFGLEDSSNLHRMERQRQYLEALQAQLNRCAGQDEDFAFTALMQVNDYLESDCTVEQLSELAQTVRDLGIGEYLTLEGEAVYNGTYMEFYVEEEALREMVVERFYEEL